VLFDLDGTLIDNMQFHTAAWIETGRLLGRELSREEILGYAGRKNEEILPLIAGHALDPEALAQYAAKKEARYRELYAPHLALIAGAQAFLERLSAAGVRCGIASAAPRDNRDFVLAGTGLASQVQAIVGGEEVQHGKPAPDLVLEAARRLSVAPANTLVFEDAISGVQAARAAGMRVIGLTTSEPETKLRAAGALATIPDFQQLPESVSQLLSS
jgi:HAD superfamily hydrolase (TIGR01509 family)